MDSEFTYYKYVMTWIIFKVTTDSCKGTEPNRSIQIFSGMTVTDATVLYIQWYRINIRWYKFNIFALILRSWAFLNCRYCRVVLGSSSLSFLETFWADVVLPLANMAFRKHLSGEWFCLPHLKPAWYSTMSTCLSLENWLISFSVNPIPMLISTAFFRLDSASPNNFRFVALEFMPQISFSGLHLISHVSVSFCNFARNFLINWPTSWLYLWNLYRSEITSGMASDVSPWLRQYAWTAFQSV